MIGAYRLKLEREHGYKGTLVKRQNTYKDTLDATKQTLIYAEEALAFIQKVAQATQGQVKVHIEDIITMALETIMDDPYKLELDFVPRRNKTECDLYFDRDGNRVDPLLASGGGAVDVAAFALRIASWSMQRPKSRNVIILDEPLRFLSANHQEQASQMIKEISEKLGIQFIIITHEPILASYADKVFETKIKKGVTEIL